MSHLINTLIAEEKLANRVDWMGDKKTEIDLWLEENHAELTDVLQDETGFYIFSGKQKIYFKHMEEEDYQFEQ